jgi:hypothetical protein
MRRIIIAIAIIAAAAITTAWSMSLSGPSSANKRAADAGNRRDVAHEIEGKIGVQCRIDGIRNRDI